MSDMKVQVVVATFEDEAAAKVALNDLKEARRAAKLDFDDSAVIRKDEDGALHINDSDDVGSGGGAGRGAVVGGIIGLLAGPAGAVVGAGAGALVGGLFNRGDDGFRDEQLEAIGAKLPAHSSAIVAVVPDVWVEQFEMEMRRHADDVSMRVLDDALAAGLQGDTGDSDA